MQKGFKFFSKHLLSGSQQNNLILRWNIRKEILYTW